MRTFTTIPKNGSLAETYFTGKSHSYTYECTLALAHEIDIDYVVKYILLRGFKEQSALKQLHIYVKTFKTLALEVQFSPIKYENIKIGSEIEQMRVIDRTPTEVLLIENCASSNFIVSFMINKIEPDTYCLTISMNILVMRQFNKFWFIFLNHFNKLLSATSCSVFTQ